MKKLVLMATCLLSIESAFSMVYYEKSRKGLFGYKYVQQTNYNNGDIYMKCDAPGLTGCKPQLIMNWPDGTILTPEVFHTIDKKVNESITESSTSGKFIFNNTFVVAYNYNMESDLVSTKIYTTKEAAALGI